MYIKSNSTKTFYFIFLYLSLLIGFYFNENSSGGAYPDFLMRSDLIERFVDDFKTSFFNYDNFRDRHSPVLVIILSTLNLLGLDLDLIRFIHLNLLPLLVFISYKCFKLKFPNKDKNIIFLICCVFFLSPTLRSISIWPDSRIFGLVLFVYSLYFFLKFKRDNKFKDCIYNNVFLIFSSYLSPNFAVFFIYFFYNYLKYLSISKKLIFMLIINSILSLPMLIYLFIYKVNFFSVTSVANIDLLTSLNPANKIFIIISLIFFYLMPFIATDFSLKKLLKNFKVNHLYISLLLFLILIFYFDYSIKYTGGGIFFKTSYFLFDNPYLFYLTVFISIIFILNFFKINSNNLLLFFILILSNPQVTIYHKYFDPLLILLFFLFFDFKFDKKNFISKNYLFNLYFLYIFFLILNLGRHLT